MVPGREDCDHLYPPASTKRLHLSLTRIRAGWRRCLLQARLYGEAIRLSPMGMVTSTPCGSQWKGRERALLVAFDLLELDGEDLRLKPIVNRRARLKVAYAKRSRPAFS